MIEQKAKKREKICLHCNGTIDLDMMLCPLCGSDISNLSEFDMKEPISTLYPPLYQQQEPAAVVAEALPMKEQSLLPPILFSAGALFLLTALLILLFSQDGAILLKIKSGFWLLFFLCSIPLIFFGWRGLNEK